jgi:ribonuclease P protein component
VKTRDSFRVKERLEQGVTISDPKKQPKTFGFPREVRLLKKREFDAVFEQGAKGITRALVIFARPNGMNLTRLGLVVSKKHGKAVRRNRIRRLLREAFRLERQNFPVGLDLVCIPRAGVFPDRLAELIPLFRTTVQKAVKGLERREGE